jgi:hypothetical protein
MGRVGDAGGEGETAFVQSPFAHTTSTRFIQTTWQKHISTECACTVTLLFLCTRTLFAV